MNKKYNYSQYYLGLRPEEGKEFDELLKNKGIGFTEFVKQAIEKEKKRIEDNSREEVQLKKQEMKDFIEDYEKLEKALKVSGDEKILSNLIRIKKRFIDKLKDL